MFNISKLPIQITDTPLDLSEFKSIYIFKNDITDDWLDFNSSNTFNIKELSDLVNESNIDSSYIVFINDDILSESEKKFKTIDIVYYTKDYKKSKKMISPSYIEQTHVDVLKDCVTELFESNKNAMDKMSKQLHNILNYIGPSVSIDLDSNKGKNKSLQQKQEELNDHYNNSKTEIILEFGKLCFKHNITVFTEVSSRYSDDGGMSEYCYFYFYKNDNCPNDLNDLTDNEDYEVDERSFVEKEGFLINLNANDFNIEIPYDYTEYWKIEFSQDGKSKISELKEKNVKK